MIRKLHGTVVGAIVTALFAATPAHAGALIINNVGTISDASVLGAINTAISNVESLYTTGNVVGDVTLNVNFSYNPAGAGNLASSSQTVYGYSYGDYTAALAADSTANPGNANLATAVAHLSDGNTPAAGHGMAVTYGQALLLSLYGLGGPSASNGSINLNSNVLNWNFDGTATSTEYDAIGAIEHEIDELLGIGGGGSVLGDCSGGNFFCTYDIGATDLYRYSGAGAPSTSTSDTYMSIDGGVTNIVDFNANSGGDYGDFAPNCGPSPGNSGNNQYIQNAFNCTGLDETYSTASPEYVALTAIGWDPVASAAIPEPAPLALLISALAGLMLTGASRRRKA